jgi:LmbE family N-acetylglucosaminyl deacetylase
MLSLSPAGGTGALRSLLVIGCHPDDGEIGCGGTVLSLTREIPDLHVTWVVLAADDVRAAEARASAAAFLAAAGTTTIEVHGFRDGFLPYEGRELKEVFEALKATVDPQLILTHVREDLHQDHRLASDLTRETFRDHLIMEYEIPKVDGDLGRPTVYFPLTASVAAEKIELIREHYKSQREKHWFDDEMFLGLMRLRGMEAVAPERYAEAFTCRRVVLQP